MGLEKSWCCAGKGLGRRAPDERETPRGARDDDASPGRPGGNRTECELWKKEQKVCRARAEMRYHHAAYHPGLPELLPY